MNHTLNGTWKLWKSRLGPANLGDNGDNVITSATCGDIWCRFQKANVMWYMKYATRYMPFENRDGTKTKTEMLMHLKTCFKEKQPFSWKCQASRDLHGSSWTSPRLGSRLSILRSKRFLQLSQRLQWMVSADGFNHLLKILILDRSSQSDTSKIILSCHSSKVWDKDLHSSTLSNPEW